MEKIRKRILFSLSGFAIGMLTIFSINIYYTLDSEYQRTLNEWRSWNQDIALQAPNSWWEWEPVRKKWIPFDINSSPISISKIHNLNLRIQLHPEGNENSNPLVKEYIYLTGIYGSFKILQGDLTIYNYGWEESHHKSNKFYGYPWHIISIPQGINNIEINIQSENKLIGPFGKSYIGSLASIFWYIFLESWDRLILGLFFLLLGSFSLLFVFDRTIRTSFVIFGLFCITIGIYTISRSPIRLFYYDNHAIWTWLNLVSVYAIPGVLFLFFHRFFSNGRFHVLYYTSLIHFAFLIYSVALSTMGVTLFLTTLPYYQFLVFVSGSISFLYIFYVTFRQRRTNQFIIIIGFIIFLVFSLQESLSAMGLTAFKYTNVYWGMLVLILSMAFVLVRKFTEMNDQLESSNKSLKRLFQIQEELESAKKVQLSLFPQVFPRSKHWDITGHYTPMDKVGGDFFDILNKDDKSIGIFLSDVSGHGLSTALLASMVKVAFTQQLDIWNQPAAVLTDLNRILVGKCGKQFITACYLYLDWENMTYKFSHAAHPSIIHYSQKSGVLHHRRTRGRMIGVWEHLIYKEEEYEFDEGDIFLVYSDGILEVGNSQDEFPNEEYLDIILKSKEESNASESQERDLKAIENRIMSYIEEWRGSKYFEDDVSFVLIQAKITGENKTLSE
jgi:phosphoserine phosphatase RsbU/P